MSPNLVFSSHPLQHLVYVVTELLCEPQRISIFHCEGKLFHLIRGQVPLWVVHILAGLHILSGVDAGGKNFDLC